MKNLVILGAGTAGTMMANHLVKKLNKKEWQITLVDQFKSHYFWWGFFFALNFILQNHPMVSMIFN